MSLPLLPDGPVSPGSPTALELRQVRKSFGDHDVLRPRDERTQRFLRRVTDAGRL